MIKWLLMLVMLVTMIGCGGVEDPTSPQLLDEQSLVSSPLDEDSAALQELPSAGDSEELAWRPFFCPPLIASCQTDADCGACGWGWGVCRPSTGCCICNQI